MQVVLNVTDEAMFGLTQTGYTITLNFPTITTKNNPKFLECSSNRHFPSAF